MLGLFPVSSPIYEIHHLVFSQSLRLVGLVPFVSDELHMLPSYTCQVAEVAIFGVTLLCSNYPSLRLTRDYSGLIEIVRRNG